MDGKDFSPVRSSQLTTKDDAEALLDDEVGGEGS